MKSIARSAFFAVLMLLGSTAAMADEALLKPFVLASKGPGTLVEKVAAVKASLLANGFTVAGEYSPYPDADILVVTSDELKNNAAQSEHGGFGAIQRIALTKVNDDIQVSYTNPVYMANVYRMKGDLQDVAARLQAALGKLEDFGAKGMTANAARHYHYMFGMEYFTDPSMLAVYGTHQEALDAVEKGLASNKTGISKVYRVDIPGTEESVFGVGMKAPSDAQKYMDDKYIMGEIDFRDIKSTAHLPYEVLVSGNKVYALYARFRIAIDFPDLSMMGSHSFMNIMSTPEAIRKALQQAVAKPLPGA
ncbi:MAG: hypothetical protein GC139_00830 [Sideroxydans sp.]|nr:hypothetical protein [Sideroxydans sp.]